MNKEDVTLLIQLLHTMKEIILKMEEYYKKKDIEKFNSTKKEVLELQQRVAELI